MSINIREYIKNNFKNNTIKEIKASVEEAISSKEEDPLIGLGVLFELAYTNSNPKEKEQILKNIKGGL